MFKPALLNIVSFPEAALVCGIYNLIILAALNYSSLSFYLLFYASTSQSESNYGLFWHHILSTISSEFKLH